MGSNAEGLRRVAASIADGSTIDWRRQSRVLRTTGQGDVIAALKLIEKVGAFRRQPTVLAQQAIAAALERRTASPRRRRWNNLVLIEEIGEGSYGKVYRAHDPALDCPVAVKLLRKTSARRGDLVRRLLHEGQTLASVRDTHVVRVRGVRQCDGQVGLWMEFIRGLTLEELLNTHGAFSAAEACVIGDELCQALAAVHRAGLVHRDVKAQNVMREEGGRYVLMDFGSVQTGFPALATGDRLAGTPLYLAPEVLEGAPATVRSDIYSLGVLLYHLVTNDFPVKAADLDGVRRAHDRREMTPLHEARPDLPEPFVQVVERAVDRDPANRFQSATRMRQALAALDGTQWRPPDPAVPFVADPFSIAVSPLVDMSPAKNRESFCDGLTEDLISALQRIPGLRVAECVSSFRFKNQSADARQIGRALNVANVLNGSVRHQGSGLRIRLELVSASNGSVLWSQTFDRKRKDVRAVQTDLAAAVAAELQGTFARDIVAPSRPRDADAYALYLEGRYHWNKRTENELRKSVDCFKQAVARDHAYAEAYAGMADAYVTLGTYGTMPALDVMPLAKTAIDDALRLDTNLAEAYTCRGCLRAIHEWAWPAAEDDFRTAIALRSGYSTAHHWYGINHLAPLGRFEDATAELQCALDLDPLALTIKTSLGLKAYFAQDHDAAVRDLTKTIELDPQFGMAYVFLGATYTEQGRYADALSALNTALRLCGRSSEILASLGYLHGRRGDSNRARRLLKEMRTQAAGHYVSPARLAQVLVGLGEDAEALDQLERACTERAADLAWINVRPVFASLRGQPRFAAILGRMGMG